MVGLCAEGSAEGRVLLRSGKSKWSFEGDTRGQNKELFRSVELRAALRNL